jgi:hypothetical protein
MAQIFLGYPVIVTTGFSAATGAASARTAIPNDASGRVPSYIRIAARNECYCKLGDSSVVATTNDMLIQPGDSQIVAVPKGVTNIAYIQGTAAGQINVVPCENS